MTKLMHSLPWTIALTLAAAGESGAIRIPEEANPISRQSSLDAQSPGAGITECAGSSSGSDPLLYDRLKKSLEM